MVCLSFSLGKAETSRFCHRMLGKRAWLTLMGNKRSLHTPDLANSGMGVGKESWKTRMLLFPPQSRRYPPVLGQRSETGKLRAKTRSFHLCSADCHTALGRVTPRGASPGGRAAEGGRHRPGSRFPRVPTGSRHPLVVSAHGRGPAGRGAGGVTERGSVLGTTHGESPAFPGKTIPAAGIYSSSLRTAQGGPHCLARGPPALPTCFTQGKR